MSSKCNSWFQYAKFSPDVRQTPRTVSPTYRTPQWLRSPPHNLWLTIYAWKVDCDECLPPPGNRALPSVQGSVCWYSVKLNSNSYYTSDLIPFTLLRQKKNTHSGVPSLFCQCHEHGATQHSTAGQLELRERQVSIKIIKSHVTVVIGMCYTPNNTKCSQPND